MKFILFCLNNYAFSILDPIRTVLQEKKYDYIWYVAPKIINDFPFKTENHTTSILKLKSYKSDVIFAPGNEIPYFLRGLKTQIFHGLAGEKKGHFRIRQYFDLYLTQGPYFTDTFNNLKALHKDFDVIETGWPKLDIYSKNKTIHNAYKAELLQLHKAKKIILYAPTFSPKLTSAPYLLDKLKLLAMNKDYLILLKFHPLMEEEWVKNYKELAKNTANIIFQSENDVTKFLLISDVLVSDTSSVIYEFILLDKPVITFNSISNNILWENSTNFSKLTLLVETTITNDSFQKNRNEIIANYHPYNDGKSALRMVEAVTHYLKENNVPEKRKISTFRKLKTYYKLIK